METRPCIMTDSANDENFYPCKSDTSKIMDNQPSTHTCPKPERCVLSDVSPNVKVGSTTPAFLKKAMAGSPLKRSFSAAIEGVEGFTYLKRRRLAENESLEEISGNSFPLALEQSNEDATAEATFLQPQESTPTEPNTPDEDGDSQSSTDLKSFSSLINYDPSSLTSNLVFKGISDAEKLRLRLRVAMYKVRTNQVHVPFSDLEVESPSPQTSMQQSVEEAVAELRREAQEVAARQSRPQISKLLPAPVLRPTAYSSRMLYDTNLPSSPPASLSLEKFPATLEKTTPLREASRINSPQLTSSVVKGRVAEGLLDLKHAA